MSYKTAGTSSSLVSGFHEDVPSAETNLKQPAPFVDGLKELKYYEFLTIRSCHVYWEF